MLHGFLLFLDLYAGTACNPGLIKHRFNFHLSSCSFSNVH